MYWTRRDGLGTPVVCLHGFCQSSFYWEPTLDRLADAGRAAMAPDLPGFGCSADLPGPYSMEAYADALATTLQRQGIARVILVGGSMGGVIAQHFALRHPHRLERLLLVATGAFTPDPEGALAKADALANAAWDTATADRVINGFFHRPLPPERTSAIRNIALMAAQPAAVAAARSNACSRTFEHLGEIAIPTMILQGRHDTVRTAEHGVEMSRRVPDCRLAVLEHSGHTPQLEQPDAFHDLAMPFLLSERS